MGSAGTFRALLSRGLSRDVRAASACVVHGEELCPPPPLGPILGVSALSIEHKAFVFL